MDEGILETFILVLIENSTKMHGKNSIRSIIAKVIMMSASINMVLKAKHR